ncbi:hypothetical protein CIRG_03589 [Coccidioides immitis RMSCC 2394]|uniref:Uncharacterized protein n=1 Tax=Coccidioides immitis RMSCC 2394 TaxID=404692 RepID=A0A0J7B253_COCIT|nr:hypothetical protein CIRG_03589 [Coccidioides immitis RMSCC 2394]
MRNVIIPTSGTGSAVFDTDVAFVDKKTTFSFSPPDIALRPARSSAPGNLGKLWDRLILKPSADHAPGGCGRGVGGRVKSSSPKVTKHLTCGPFINNERSDTSHSGRPLQRAGKVLTIDSMMISDTPPEPSAVDVQGCQVDDSQISEGHPRSSEDFTTRNTEHLAELALPFVTLHIRACVNVALGRLCQGRPVPSFSNGLHEPAPKLPLRHAMAFGLADHRTGGGRGLTGIWVIVLDWVHPQNPTLPADSLPRTFLLPSSVQEESRGNWLMLRLADQPVPPNQLTSKPPRPSPRFDTNLTLNKLIPSQHIP